MSRRRALVSAVIALSASIGVSAAAIDRFPMSAGGGQTGRIYTARDSDVTKPVVMREVKPQYTREAMREKIQGSVWTTAVVNESGDVTDVQIERSLDAEYGLDRRAVEAVYQWKFKPASRDGKPVAFRVTIELTFSLR